MLAPSLLLAAVGARPWGDPPRRPGGPAPGGGWSRRYLRPSREKRGGHVAYISPNGWVEPKKRRDGGGDNELGIFHLRRDCERIRRPDQLRAIDRPYSAARCTLCAPEL